MILVAGVPTDGPTELLIESLESLGCGYILFDQRQHADTSMYLRVEDDAAGGALSGEITTAAGTVRLEDIQGVFLRMMSEENVLQTQQVPVGSAVAHRCRALHRLIYSWTEVCPARVLNRASDMASNSSKPFQMQVARECGFSIPETMITTDPLVAREFIQSIWQSGDQVIYKSISGVRSIVQEVREADFGRLDHIRWCPTQFQRRVCGVDIRVHVIGESIFAVRIESQATDYRYSVRQVGSAPDLSITELDRANTARCRAMAQKLNLPLAGIDLRITPDQQTYCFEANPSPAFNYYQDATGAPISDAIARYLAHCS
ncbi:MAG: hypothetical protein SFV81_10500 [Pirellulaceae bacterium]|nr:hypothetical protein [Pirellulaceae bacterium]